MPPVSYARHQFPTEVIGHAVWLYLRFTLSYRDVEDLLAERGLDISHETVRRWVLKFGPAIARRLRRNRPKPSPRRHLDEMAVRIACKQMSLWRAEDDEGEVLDVLVQRRRNKAAACKQMCKLLKKHCTAPTEIIIDKLRSYGASGFGASGLRLPPRWARLDATGEHRGDGGGGPKSGSETRACPLRGAGLGGLRPGARAPGRHHRLGLARRGRGVAGAGGAPDLLRRRHRGRADRQGRVPPRASQAEGLVASIFALLGLALPVPDHTTLSRRGRVLRLERHTSAGRGIDLAIDSTGLRLARPPGAGSEGWRKLHIAVDPDSGRILAEELTRSEVHDTVPVPAMLARTEGRLGRVYGDGAHAGGPTHRAVAEHRQALPNAEGVFRPKAPDVRAANRLDPLAGRGRHAQHVARDGRAAWERATGYGRRDAAEWTSSRLKRALGRGLRSRSIDAQRSEAAIAVLALNRMAGLGMPRAQRVA